MSGDVALPRKEGAIFEYQNCSGQECKYLSTINNTDLIKCASVRM